MSRSILSSQVGKVSKAGGGMGGGEALFSLLFSKLDGGTRSWDPWVSREEKTRSGIKRPAESPGAASQDRAPERCWETGWRE